MESKLCCNRMIKYELSAVMNEHKNKQKTEEKKFWLTMSSTLGCPIAPQHDAFPYLLQLSSHGIHWCDHVLSSKNSSEIF
jgi:hypothetical protein